MKHTEGIWKKGKEVIGVEGGLRTEINGGSWFGLAAVVTRMNDATEDNPEGVANLERIIACVNALAGIENVEQFVQLAKAHEEVVRSWETTMMTHLGEDGLGSAVNAINKMKAEINTLKSERSKQLVTLTETDRDNLCDIIWWLRGYKKGAENTFNDCPFHQDHLDTLEKTTTALREIFNQKK